MILTVEGDEALLSGTSHDLKTWPGPFAAVRAGLKPWELRKNDRDYQVGDLLRLREWCPDLEDYSGAIEERRVTWALHGPAFGLPEGYVIMSLAGVDAAGSEAKQPGQLRDEQALRISELERALEPSQWSDEELEAYARQIVQRRGKYRYAYTDDRAIKIVLDVLLDFRSAFSGEK